MKSSSCFKVLSRRMETAQKRRGIAVILCIAHIFGRLDDAVMIRRTSRIHRARHQYAQSSAIERVRDLQRVV